MNNIKVVATWNAIPGYVGWASEWFVEISIVDFSWKVYRIPKPRGIPTQKAIPTCEAEPLALNEKLGMIGCMQLLL